MLSQPIFDLLHVAKIAIGIFMNILANCLLKVGHFCLHFNRVRHCLQCAKRE